MSKKTFVITGAASGIGARTAALLMARGDNVIGLDRSPPGMPVTRYIAVDLADPGSIEHAVAQVEPSIDGLCNVAGVPPTQGTLAVLGVNVLGLRTLTELLVPRMNEGASIVNVASLAGSAWQARLPDLRSFLDTCNFTNLADVCERLGIGDDECYQFSKEAIIVWTLMSFDAWRMRGVRMNCVSPGPVDTAILKDFRATIGRHFGDAVSTLGDKKVATAEEIASVIAFLCSDASRWIRGVNIPVDGGASAAMVRKRLASQVAG